MGKEDQMILVVPRTKLFNNEKDIFEGFHPRSDPPDYEKRILEYYDFMKRGPAEKDPNFKQIIAYCLVVNPNLAQLFAYQRSSKNYSEKRLQGRISWGIGGHIEKSDIGNNPIHSSMLRELREEVHLDGKIIPEISGYVNYDKDEVSKVHFGVLYLVMTDSKVVLPGDPEIIWGNFINLERVKNFMQSKDYEVENWSQIAYVPITKFFGLPWDKFVSSKEQFNVVGVVLDDLSDFTEFVEGNKERLNFNRVSVKEAGMSFEPRLQETFKVSLDEIVLGLYIETTVYQKDFETKVCRFGRYEKRN